MVREVVRLNSRATTWMWPMTFGGGGAGAGGTGGVGETLGFECATELIRSS